MFLAVILGCVFVFLMMMFRPKNVFKNSLLGVALLAVINLTSFITGIWIGFGLFPLAFSFVLGLPGALVLAMLCNM